MRLAITFKFTHSFKSDNAQKSLLFVRALGSLRFMKPFLFLEKSRIEGLSAFSKPLLVGRTIFDLLVISGGFVLVGRFTGFTFTTSAERGVGFHGGSSFGATTSTLELLPERTLSAILIPLDLSRVETIAPRFRLVLGTFVADDKL